MKRSATHYFNIGWNHMKSIMLFTIPKCLSQLFVLHRILLICIACLSSYSVHLLLKSAGVVGEYVLLRITLRNQRQIESWITKFIITRWEKWTDFSVNKLSLCIWTIEKPVILPLHKCLTEMTAFFFIDKPKVGIHHMNQAVCKLVVVGSLVSHIQKCMHSLLL